MNRAGIITLYLLFIMFFILSIVFFFMYDTCDSGIVKYKRSYFTNTENDPVDAVYTWVNSKDPSWIELKNKNKMKMKKFDDSKQRYINTNGPADELMLSVRSVRKYLPWIDNIYVVTMRPQSLPKDFVKKYNIKIVHHDEIFTDKSVLPTFNSKAIESQLYNIKDLHNNFIYFNDDMYINKPMKVDDFFIDNKPIFRYKKKETFAFKIFSRLIKNSYKQSFHTLSNIYNKELLDTIKNKYLVPIHHPLPITKNIVQQTKKQFPTKWKNIQNNKFRSVQIIPLYLAINIGLHSGDAIVLKDDSMKHTYMEDFKMYNQNNHMVCVNYIKPQDFKELETQILAVPFH